MTHQIKLSGLKFFAHHGLYEEEQKKGGWFIVDIQFNCDATEAMLNDEITGTVNYEEIYNLVKEEMLISSKLIEHLAARIHKRILLEVKGVFDLILTVKKLEAPLGGPLDYVGFTIRN